jgi:hypothetical protein
MGTQTPFDSASALEVARSFHSAAVSLEQVAAQTQACVRSGNLALTGEAMKQLLGEKSVPVVLHALAIEILLKVRLHRAGVKVRKTHDHDKLYANLPVAERKALSRRYVEQRRFPFKSQSLQAALEWSTDAFEKWRYRYEWQNVNASVGEMLLVYEVLSESL